MASARAGRWKIETEGIHSCLGKKQPRPHSLPLPALVCSKTPYNASLLPRKLLTHAETSISASCPLRVRICLGRESWMTVLETLTRWQGDSPLPDFVT